MLKLAINIFLRISSRVKESNSIKCYWGDAFESIKSAEDSKYDKIFVDLNDDQYCIDLAAKNMNGFKKNFKTWWCYYSSSWI